MNNVQKKVDFKQTIELILYRLINNIECLMGLGESLSTLISNSITLVMYPFLKTGQSLANKE